MSVVLNWSAKLN